MTQIRSTEETYAAFAEWLKMDSARDELLALIPEEAQKEIRDRFYCDLEFGTGGLRGVMGAGTNRMNEPVVAMATQGLANYTRRAQGRKGKLSAAVIAQKMKQTGLSVSARSVERVMEEWGLQKKLYACGPGRVSVETHRTKQRRRAGNKDGHKPVKTAQTFFCLDVEEFFNAEQHLGWNRAGTLKPSHPHRTNDHGPDRPGRHPPVAQTPRRAVRQLERPTPGQARLRSHGRRHPRRRRHRPRHLLQCP